MCRRRARVGQRSREFGGARKAICGELLERRQDRRLDVQRDRLPLQGKGPRLFRHHARDDRLRRRPREGGLTHEHLVGDAAERVNVGACCDLALAHRLPWGHIARSA